MLKDLLSETDTDLGRIYELLYLVETDQTSITNAMFPRIPDAVYAEERLSSTSEPADKLNMFEFSAVIRIFEEKINEAGVIYAVPYDDMYEAVHSLDGRLDLAYKVLTRIPSFATVRPDGFVTYLMNACRALHMRGGCGLQKRGSFYTYQQPELTPLKEVSLKEALDDEDAYIYNSRKYRGPREVHYAHLLDQIRYLHTSGYTLTAEQETSIAALLHALLEMVDYNRQCTASVSGHYLALLKESLEARFKQKGCARSVWGSLDKDITAELGSYDPSRTCIIPAGSVNGERLRSLIYSYV